MKDIESHIEIIYECLDELSESTSSVNASTTSEVSPSKPDSVEASTSHESENHHEKTATEKPEPESEEDDKMKTENAQNESKSE